MDFVDWSDSVLMNVVDARRASTQARSMGVDRVTLAQTLFGEDATRGDFHGSQRSTAMFDALLELRDLGLVETDGGHLYWKVTQQGRDVAPDTTGLWRAVCQIELLEPEEQQVLHAVNRLSSRVTDAYAWLEWVYEDTLLSELNWPDGRNVLWPVVRDLAGRGLLKHDAGLSAIRVHASYAGLVWETRRAFTIESEFIDDLVAEWETTSVDFKREVHTKTADEKAELVKDVLGLVNTQASGRRWLIIGFDDKTRRYHGPPDPKLTQNHLEQLMSEYTTPPVVLSYEAVAYRDGSVGRLEVKRDRRLLPYRVAKSVGDRAAGGKRRIEAGQVFVRHGSQTMVADADEIAALEAEATWAYASGQQQSP